SGLAAGKHVVSVTLTLGSNLIQTPASTELEIKTSTNGNQTNGNASNGAGSGKAGSGSSGTSNAAGSNSQ
ncbi:MAG: hypothetical protein PUF56_08010, partial [Lachnospiraceae bacterium]|nr:hypothetical protein [Lachnospiraceae bacterium]